MTLESFYCYFIALALVITPFIIILTSHFSKINSIFQGIDMFENSQNIAHMPKVMKIDIWYGFYKSIIQGLYKLHLSSFNEVPLKLHFT